MIDAQTKARWFDASSGWNDPILQKAGIIIGAIIVVAYVLTLVLSRAGKIRDTRRTELIQRINTWVIIVIAFGLPLVLGAFWTILFLLLLSIICYREFARMTGLFRSYMVSAAAVIGIFAVFFAVFDHWYGFFSALPALGVALIVTFGVLRDRPVGYLQRIALAVVSFVMFGVSLGHIAYIANDSNYRIYLLLFFVAVELNDVFAYLAGNLFGRKKLAPNTSPNKTVGGAVGAVIGTTALVWVVGQWIFAGTPLDSPARLLGLGVLLSIAGQLGDLVISSVKRDIGIKDTGNTLPGHGGILDRFDSILIAGPAYFHYLGYFIGFGLNEPSRILSGG